MRIRLAAAALVALVTGAVVTLTPESGGHGSRATPELTSHSWSVQISTDFGTTWDSRPLTEGTTAVPIRVDTAVLQARPAYQAVTLRTATGSARQAVVQPGSFRASAGSADAAHRTRIRAVTSPGGSCSAITFTGAGVALLAGTAEAGAPLGTPPSGSPITLEGATATTPGSPQTVCLELSTVDGPEPADQTAAPDPADGAVTVAWPLTTRPATD